MNFCKETKNIKSKKMELTQNGNKVYKSVEL
jgi:hypothetical protein